MQHQPEKREDHVQSERKPARSLSRRAATAWRDIRDARGVRATLIKIGVVLVLAWLLAGAIQQLVIVALVIFTLWLIFDVIRRNIFR